MMVVTAGMMLVMPKMMEGMDPEQKEQMQRQMEMQQDPTKVTYKILEIEIYWWFIDYNPIETCFYSMFLIYLDAEPAMGRCHGIGGRGSSSRDYEERIIESRGENCA